MSDNLARIMTKAAEENPDGIAVKLDDTEVSYAMLEEGSARMAAILKDKGVGPGDRVGIMLPNVPYFPVVYYGVLRAGGVVVPMNPLLKGREVKYYLEDPGAKLLVAWGDFEEPATKGAEDAGVECILVKPGEFEKLLGEVEEPAHVLEDRDPDDTAVILYTSGTTGQPKGAELTHSNMYKNCTVAADHLGEISKEDKLLGALPLFHSFGQTCTLNGAVHAQAMVSMIPRFDPEKALEIIERDGITLFQGVPTMYNGMLHASNKDDVDTSTLRVCMSGGSAMPEEVMRAFEKQFGCKVLEGYGLSETSPVASFNHPDKENKAGSIGTPIEGVEMKLVDDDDNEVARRRGRRDRHQGPQHHEGLLGARGGHGRGHRGRLVLLGRHGQARRGRLLLHRRPQEGADHPRRLQRVPARDRGGALRARRGPGGGRDRRAPRRAGRGGGRRDRAQGGRGRGRRRHQGSTSRSRWRRTSTRARCGSWTSCPRARPARSSSARSRRRTRRARRRTKPRPHRAPPL